METDEFETPVQIIPALREFAIQYIKAKGEEGATSEEIIAAFLAKNPHLRVLWHTN